MRFGPIRVCLHAPGARVPLLPSILCYGRSGEKLPPLGRSHGSLAHLPSLLVLVYVLELHLEYVFLAPLVMSYYEGVAQVDAKTSSLRLFMFGPRVLSLELSVFGRFIEVAGQGVTARRARERGYA